MNGTRDPLPLGVVEEAIRKIEARGLYASRQRLWTALRPVAQWKVMAAVKALHAAGLVRHVMPGKGPGLVVGTVPKVRDGSAERVALHAARVERELRLLGPRAGRREVRS